MDEDVKLLNEYISLFFLNWDLELLKMNLIQIKSNVRGRFYDMMLMYDHDMMM